MRIIKWYGEFVSEQIRDLPKGTRNRGWTVFGLWAMLLVPLIVIGASAAYFLGFDSFMWFLIVLAAIEIIFRMVDRLSR